MKYRVFDSKGSFVQAYDAALSGALIWARDCARSVGGFVMEFSPEQFSNESEGSIVCDFRINKTQ
jgi:hypothetical protein